jgi:PIN domain nuclease of toxin-antitoxin system
VGPEGLRLLLDTHALIWFASDAPQLSEAARSALEDEGNEVLVSAVNALEIAIKHRLGKLPSGELLATDFERQIAGRGLGSLAMTATHARIAGALPGDHNDPFDRILAAQALLEGLTIVSRDAALDAFGVIRLW